MVREEEKWLGIRIRDRSKKLKSSSDFRPNHNTEFQWNRLITFAVIHPQTDWTSDTQTDMLAQLAPR